MILYYCFAAILTDQSVRKTIPGVVFGRGVGSLQLYINSLIAKVYFYSNILHYGMHKL